MYVPTTAASSMSLFQTLCRNLDLIEKTSATGEDRRVLEQDLELYRKGLFEKAFGRKMTAKDLEERKKVIDLIEPGDLIVRAPSSDERWTRQEAKKQPLAYRAYKKLYKGFQGDLSHVSIYGGEGSVATAVYGGVENAWLMDQLGDQEFAIYRPKHTDKNTIQKAVDWAEKQDGKPYDWGGVKATAAGMVLPEPVVKGVGSFLRRKHKPSTGYHCSGLVAKAFEEAGAPISDVPFTTAAPSDVIKSDKVELIMVGGTDKLRKPQIYSRGNPLRGKAAVGGGLAVAGTVHTLAQVRNKKNPERKAQRLARRQERREERQRRRSASTA